MTRALLVMLAWVRMLMLVRGKWTLSLSQHLRTKRVAALRQACLPYARSHGFYSSRCHFSTSMIQLVLAHITHKFKKGSSLNRQELNFRTSCKAVTQPDNLSSILNKSFQVIWILDEQTRLSGNF